MHWTDLLDERRNDAWVGLQVATSKAECPRRPAFRMEAGGPRLMRLACGETSLLWARVVRGDWGYTYLRASPPHRGMGVLPPLRFDDARSKAAVPRSDDWYKAWARSFAHELAQSPCSPLQDGTMLLARAESWRDDGSWGPAGGRVAVPPFNFLESVNEVLPHDFADWQLELAPLPLRPLSDPASSRVKAYRKSARDGVLPPVLVMWMSGLQRYVILDGHDRLLASLLENGLPACLALLPLTECPVAPDPKRVAAVVNAVEQHVGARRPGRRELSVDQANRLLIGIHDDRPYLRIITRAWPLEGGPFRWFSEVRRELAHVPDADDAMLL
ncbi:hypothetical protein LVJ94_13835 [Pendulispora rubella]|uniref:Uncharacterized protein n=1 Tax=Pendulispora rubella TaxID=2741070 RepID=A0ABZ2LC37_9BACT